jgi:hypothetical protein
MHIINKAGGRPRFTCPDFRSTAAMLEIPRPRGHGSTDRLVTSGRRRLRGRCKVCRQIVILFLSASFIVSADHLARRCHMPFDNPHHSPFGDAELLWDARSRVSSSRDWVQGRFKDGNRLCIVGALSLVSGSSSFDTPNRVERRLARVLALQIPPSVPFWMRMRLMPARRRLIYFNDDPLTSHTDVMALFDRAIDRPAADAFISRSPLSLVRCNPQ